MDVNEALAQAKQEIAQREHTLNRFRYVVAEQTKALKERRAENERLQMVTAQSAELRLARSAEHRRTWRFTPTAILLKIAGHLNRPGSGQHEFVVRFAISDLGHERTSHYVRSCPIYPPKADIPLSSSNWVRFRFS
jgi:hypothetical protein